MSYCSNCGKYVEEGSKFCGHCGAPLAIDRSRRRQEYIGKVIKCPACGQELSSFMAICPSCGHEINSAQISTTIEDFTYQIRQCDLAISASHFEPKRGWSSWGKWEKIGWVLLNINTFYIPLIIYLLLPLLGIGGMAGFTPDEKKKAQFISTYNFPNDRESILEGLLFIKSQMSALAAGKIDRNTARWIKVWKSKATQLFDRSEILFKGDSIANDAFKSILQCEKRVKITLLLKVLVVTVVVGAFSAFIFTRAGIKNAFLRANEEAKASFEWPSSGVALQIPEPPSYRGKIEYDNEKEFWVEVRGIGEESYTAYIDSCRESGFTIEVERSSTRYEAYNDEGYKLELYYYSSHREMNIHVYAPEKLGVIQWPKSELANHLPIPASTYGRIKTESDDELEIYLGSTTKQAFDDYAAACYDAGFTLKYKKTDTYFRADNSEGYSIRLEYKGFNIVFIKFEAP